MRWLVWLAGWALLVAGADAGAQFEVLTSPTTASLRGVSVAGPGVAWVSGSGGAIFRTEDAGYLWQRCSTPPGGAELDFRGVVGQDAQRAVVMSSGKGAASKVFRTTDGCASWTLVFEDPDAEGFFDAVQVAGDGTIEVLGDAVGGEVRVWQCGTRCALLPSVTRMKAAAGEGSFAASNSVLQAGQSRVRWMSEAPGHAWFRSPRETVALPMDGGGAASGVFSFAFRDEHAGVALGGDYEKPAQRERTAAWTSDGGKTWTAATAMPHGFRSAVAYDAAAKAWLAVGPSGADVSYDDGRTWTELKGPNAAGWNAIALPYVVGTKGSIGRLAEGALKR